MKYHHKKVLSSQSGNRLCHGRSELIGKLYDSPETGLVNRSVALKNNSMMSLPDPNQRQDTYINQESGTEIDYSQQTKPYTPQQEDSRANCDVEIATTTELDKTADTSLSASLGVTFDCRYFLSCHAHRLRLNSGILFDCSKLNPCQVRKFYDKYPNWGQLKKR